MTKQSNRSVGVIKAKQLIAERGGRLDASFFQNSTLRLYRLNDGGAVVMLPTGHGRHWDSYDELVTRYQDAERRTKAGWRSPAEMIPLGVHFTENINRLIEELPARLDIDAALLDQSEESLEHVDAAIRRQIERSLEPEVFQCLIAYTGEVIRRAVRGEWELRNRSGVWEPEVKDQRGVVCAVLPIYKELYEHRQRASLRAFANVAVRRHRVDASPGLTRNKPGRA